MKYTLIVDLGNTNAKFNIFSGEKLVCYTPVKVRKSKFIYLSVKLIEMLRANSIKREDIVDGMIFSVVPSLSKRVQRIVRHVLKVKLEIFRNKNINFDMVGIPDMNEIGADLLGDIIGALEMYKTPMMIVDLGTITKSLFINEQKELIGASFIPGLDLSLHLMKNNTGLLPTSRVQKPKTWYGTNTLETMNTGAYFSNVCAVRFYKQMMEKDNKNITFILSGGYSSLIEDHVKPDFVEPHLAAIGMNYIYRKYMKK